MENLVLRAPAVGGLVKKVIAINPDLSTAEIIQIIRQSIRVQGGNDNEFASAEIIDEENVLKLVRASLFETKCL